MAALVLDAGTGLNYFTGISWWPSERTMVAIIPAKGEVQYICPGFEEARLREQVSIGKDVYAGRKMKALTGLFSPYLRIQELFPEMLL